MSTSNDEATKDTKIAFLVPSQAQRSTSRFNHNLALPRALASHSRASSSGRNVFMSEAALQVDQVFDLSHTGRSAEASDLKQEFVSAQLMVLEAQDGSIVMMRADKLQAELQRLYPQALQAGGPIDLSIIKERDTPTRGLETWIWSKLSILTLSSDSFIRAAEEQASEWLEDKLGQRFADLAQAQASWIGAKALMAVIESKLEGEPGLYRWNDKQIQLNDRINAEDKELTTAAKNNEPILIFIHGTGSNTASGFGDLRSENQEISWDHLTRPFSQRVYSFEHRTLSESPLDNALQLAKTLPKGCRFSLVTHSRGGLVGDLLCLDNFQLGLIEQYQRRPVNRDGKLESAEQRKIRELIVTQERQQLAELHALLLAKQFQIDRYVRVACPAGGTRLMADNIDLFLSGLLSLLSFGAGFIPVVGAVSASILNAFRRIVLEIAAKRIDPRFIPGLEAMLPDSPLSAFLANASRSSKIQVLAITGNTDTDQASILKRIAIIFTDWVVFGRTDNDFVVDTQSMRAGLAKRNSSYEFYTQGHQVSHVNYFQRTDTRHALYQWLTHQEPNKLAGFTRIPTDCDLKLDTPMRSAAIKVSRSSTRPSNAPIVFYLPGIMGSHLSIRPEGQNTGDRIWFDPFDLAAGGIYSLKMDVPNILATGMFERYYGDLKQYLENSYEVIPFAYDWRQSLSTLAKQFAELVKAKLQELETHQQQRPINILAHSMGGLVVRMLMASPKLSEVWEQIAKRPSSHLVMLGTPNQGSYAAVESLIGKGQGMRYLASLDFHHNLQQVLDVIGEFDGLLHLLPTDHSPENTLDYFDPKTWEQLKNLNRDRWFGNGQGVGAVPSKARLNAAKKAWELLKQQETSAIPHADRIAYVFGVDTHTPLKLKIEDDQLVLEGTTEGDGSVTWEAGRLKGLDASQYWYLPASHSNLTNTPAYFAAIAELLQSGTTKQLEQNPPRQRSRINRSYRYEAGPVLHAGAEEVALAFFGDRPQRDPVEDSTQTLQVAVRAMDLRFVQQPIICGHYQADAIASAERMIDQYLLNGALSQRERLGIYAGPVSTSTIILHPRSAEDLKRNTCRGAIIVGLGEWSQISTQKITDTVRDGVLNYLLTVPLNPQLENSQTEQLGLNSLLIGYNSTTHITVEASIEAIVRGVCEANQQYRYNCTETQPKRAIARLDFIEFYLDTAISAAYLVRDLPKRLETELQRLEARLIPASELIAPRYQGVRHRLSERTIGGGYWPRLMVTNAEENKEHSSLDNTPAELLKYVYLSERARAETVIQQRQPGLIEALISDAITSSEYKQEISRTLFQLMIPFDFKSAARQTSRLLLILDSYTANLPWEMLQADDEPLALQVQMVRQLSSIRFRRRVTTTISKTACVIANPLTSNFFRKFPAYDPEPENKEGDKSLASLAGATDEGLQVADLLERNDYTVERCLPAASEDAPNNSALDVFNILFKRPYRILMIAAHGEVNLKGTDGKYRTGVILSDGSLLTAAEVSQMEEIPDLVFLNCCHLATITGTKTVSYNRLAYSLSRELIEMGVRCVIAAGWAVDDAAACTFSTTFFEYFISRQQSFGQAVYEARRQTRLLYPHLNTWGAYQAYGDPSFVLDPTTAPKHAHACHQQISAYELQDYLNSLHVDMHHKVRDYTFQSLYEELERVSSNISNPAWLSAPGTQYQLAQLYGNVLPDGFVEARKACQAAIAEEDRNGHVPIVALELMANLESRQAEALALKALELNEDNPERIALFEEAKELAQAAIERLQGLLAITKYVQIAAAVDNPVQLSSNTERYALLGSAYKRLAMILLQQNQAWPSIETALRASLKAYSDAEGTELNAKLKAYPLINRLQLTAVLNQIDPLKFFELLDRAHTAVRAQFLESNDFFDAAMSADIDITRFLANEEITHSHADFIQLYVEAIRDVATTARNFNSVVQQLRILAQLLSVAAKHLHQTNNKRLELSQKKVEILQKVAAALESL
ncbi:MAG: CHAT domain-containing protein [Thiolinea sp.]